MSNIFQKFKDYFSFTRSELLGISVLLLIIITVLLLPQLYSKFRKPDKTDFSKFEKDINNFEKSLQKLHDTTDYKNIDYDILNEDEPERPVHLFNFNPNEITVDKWKELGLKDRQIKTINNYLAKGGRFRKKEDLQKIYGIDEDLYKRLEPFIIIHSIDSAYHKTSYIFTHHNNYKNFKQNFVIELNSADSLQLMRLRGIGSVFARKIINYRKLLGGYFRKEQLLEVWGMDSVRYNMIKDYISVNIDSINKININNTSFKRLVKHPYIQYNLAITLVNYKKVHGDFKELDEIRNCAGMNDTLFEKLSYYIKVK